MIRAPRSISCLRFEAETYDQLSRRSEAAGVVLSDEDRAYLARRAAYAKLALKLRLDGFAIPARGAA